MERYEMAELLRDKANVSYEAAKKALEENDWNMLEAMVALEQQGKMGKAEAPKSHKPQATEPNLFIKAVNWLTNLIDKGNRSYFIIRKAGNELTRMPVTVFVALIILLHGFSIFALILGLIFGYEYTFLGAQQIEEAKEAARQAETAADELKDWHTVNSMNV